MVAAEQDATRSRLIDAAGAVFAEKGFGATTVREICRRAGANVAAVNYHFRDKQGLYLEVLRRSVEQANQEDEADIAGVASPEEALRKVIAGMLRRTCSTAERGTWHARIMAHELANPTPALDRVVQEVIRPRYGNLLKIISAIIQLPPEDAATRMCAHSVIGQVTHYAHARPVIDRLWPSLLFDPGAIADHIVTFSLAGLRLVAGRQKI